MCLCRGQLGFYVLVTQKPGYVYLLAVFSAFIQGVGKMSFILSDMWQHGQMTSMHIFSKTYTYLIFVINTRIKRLSCIYLNCFTVTVIE
jgi:hypothetical protein